MQSFRDNSYTFQSTDSPSFYSLYMTDISIIKESLWEHTTKNKAFHAYLPVAYEAGGAHPAYNQISFVQSKFSSVVKLKALYETLYCSLLKQATSTLQGFHQSPVMNALLVCTPVAYLSQNSPKERIENRISCLWKQELLNKERFCSWLSH